MSKAGSERDSESLPLWLLAELTYRCPLQCPYCSNPVNIAGYRKELTTDEWLEVMRQARALGAAQLGFSGGEPLARRDLEVLIKEARELGYYTNLITSGVGMDEERVKGFRQAGLDYIQISFQASSADLNNFLGGTASFEHKLEMARVVKQYDYPMALNIVTHRQNIDQTEHILAMAEALEADYVELANAQYYGWALVNRAQLMPTREQLERSEKIANAYMDKLKGKMKIYYVVPDYFEDRPKACMNGWGNVFLSIAPDGTALPCQAAAQLPGLSFPNVREHSVEWIWKESPAFNRFRGFDWMKEPCRSCPERFKDFGGCRCQAYMLTGDPTNTDPVCSLSPQHDIVVDATQTARADADGASKQMVFRNFQNSKLLVVEPDG